MADQMIGRDPLSGQAISVHFTEAGIEQITSVESDTQLWISPGLLDLQVNGFAGHDINSAELSLTEVEAFVRALAENGTTRAIPTVITSSEAQICRSLSVIDAARRANPIVHNAIPYVHIEGPHISAEDGPRGVHPAEHIRPPDVAEFKRWQEAGRGLVGMVTLSAHYAEAPAYIRALTDSGVRCAIGHTSATPDEVLECIEAGAVHSTHLGNGAHEYVLRHPNYIWTQLADDRLTAGFIGDGLHLPEHTLRSMVRAKGRERSIIVSDSIALAGLPAGVYETPVGGQVELTADGRTNKVGTPFMSGAARPLADCVATTAKLAQIGLGDALQMATINPSRHVDDRGWLSVGEPADLIQFAWEPGADRLDIRQVVQGGRLLEPAA
ncbi:N-acetylglucosamine-6-phosphate deacetylase [Sinosporangium siamense]|uniref:Amidohydrolase-related domain-containing protein n=1 Tax=Sinosporangium siamense TaxID=1367973 RepID=A0A919RN72_9ACTN|nr:amidohydrolase family protein [Sinosporangium siamense]GII95549.1 hypothetical protein Ssi02_57800 [Sinosporangium siamense]